MKNILFVVRGWERVDWEVIRNVREECDFYEIIRYLKKIFGYVKVLLNDYFCFGFIVIMVIIVFMCIVLCIVV